MRQDKKQVWISADALVWAAYQRAMSNKSRRIAITADELRHLLNLLGRLRP